LPTFSARLPTCKSASRASLCRSFSCVPCPEEKRETVNISFLFFKKKKKEWIYHQVALGIELTPRALKRVDTLCSLREFLVGLLAGLVNLLLARGVAVEHERLAHDVGNTQTVALVADKLGQCSKVLCGVKCLDCMSC